MQNEVIITQEHNLGIITLNKPAVLNAVNLEMTLEIQKQLEIWQDDPSIEAVVIKSAHNRAFCAGGDIKALYEQGQSDINQAYDFFRAEYALNATIGAYPKPYIALLDGITMGGGVGISMHGSHILASENFIFAMPETSIGLFPDIGSSYLFAKCPGYIGIYLGLLGTRLKAQEALDYNLIHHCLPSNKFEVFLADLKTLELHTDAHAKISRCAQKYYQQDLADKNLALQKLVDPIFSLRSMHAIIVKLRENDTEWSSNTLDALKQRSPLSLCITLEQLHRARSSSLTTCLQTDWQIVQKILKNPDFYEGVRATLIDKDKNPQWQQENIENISPETINYYFANMIF
jgi:enoyl-CoA hydratase